jgi:hypothetical protein
MPLWPFRRRETLNERLVREAGLDIGSLAGGSPAAGSLAAEPAADPDPAELEESWFGNRSVPLFERLSGEITAPRPRRWDAVVSAEAPEVGGEEAEFVALPDGSLVVDDEQAEGDLTPLAEAVETRIGTPYRAHCVRRGDRVWAVAARKIDVASFAAHGDEVTLSEHGGDRTLTVDGARAFGSIPELEAIGRREGDSYVVRARRLDGDLWEVSADPL